ncbi:hypothetical protein [Mesorhizobium sp. M0220]|uniref:hypothetical protein n=1 Tax=Mesorhizobium sp. M0220 TaxID=2956920 RepID=UPI00333A7E1C
MLSRRSFTKGGACCICASIVPSHGLAQEDEEFICSTVAPPQQDFLVQDFAATEGLDPSAVDAAALAATTNFKITPYGTAFLNQRWRLSDSLAHNMEVITLGIAFLGGTNAQKSAVRTLAPEWIVGEVAARIQFQFDVSVERSHIRVAFDPKGGNNSLVGRASLLAPKAKKTMNLQQVSRRAILHEFGHALGLQHEHMHPTLGIIWNEPAVISDMKASQGWKPETTRRNILNKYTIEAACIGDPSPNRESIMMYPIPARWTLNGFSTKLNTSISDRDLKCVAGLYEV